MSPAGSNNWNDLFWTTDKYVGTWESPWLWLLLVSCFINSIYSYTWDIKMDWGLLDSNAGENKFLREEVVYSSAVSNNLAQYYFKSHCLLTVHTFFSPELLLLRHNWRLHAKIRMGGELCTDGVRLHRARSDDFRTSSPRSIQVALILTPPQTFSAPLYKYSMTSINDGELNVQSWSICVVGDSSGISSDWRTSTWTIAASSEPWGIFPSHLSRAPIRYRFCGWWTRRTACWIGANAKEAAKSRAATRRRSECCSRTRPSTSTCPTLAERRVSLVTYTVGIRSPLRLEHFVGSSLYFFSKTSKSILSSNRINALCYNF